MLQNSKAKHCALRAAWTRSWSPTPPRPRPRRVMIRSCWSPSGACDRRSCPCVVARDVEQRRARQPTRAPGLRPRCRTTRRILIAALHTAFALHTPSYTLAGRTGSLQPALRSTRTPTSPQVHGRGHANAVAASRSYAIRRPRSGAECGQPLRESSPTCLATCEPGLDTRRLEDGARLAGSPWPVSFRNDGIAPIPAAAAG